MLEPTPTPTSPQGAKLTPPAGTPPVPLSKKAQKRAAGKALAGELAANALAGQAEMDTAARELLNMLNTVEHQVVALDADGQVITALAAVPAYPGDWMLVTGGGGVRLTRPFEWGGAALDRPAEVVRFGVFALIEGGSPPSGEPLATGVPGGPIVLQPGETFGFPPGSVNLF